MSEPHSRYGNATATVIHADFGRRPPAPPPESATGWQVMYAHELVLIAGYHQRVGGDAALAAEIMQHVHTAWREQGFSYAVHVPGPLATRLQLCDLTQCRNEIDVAFNTDY